MKNTISKVRALPAAVSLAISTLFATLFATLFSIGLQAEPLVRLSTNFGDIVIDMTPEVAPQTVANFLDYVNSGAFDESFFHRNPTPQGSFVLQGGEAFWPEGAATYSRIADNAPVINEFNVSNTRGTVAMAKLGGDPNSATNNFFVNLADNGSNLDVQNEGFTVFGTIDSAGMAIVDTIAALPVIATETALSDTLPVTNSSVAFSRATAVLINSAEVVDGAGGISAPAAAILPASRSISVGASATGFATVINTAASEALGCTMQPVTEVAADFFYRRTNPSTNLPFGVNNPSLNIPQGEFISLLFSFTPTASFDNTTVEFDFDCTNADEASVINGVNTFDLAASDSPIADVVALGGTTTADGISNISLSADQSIASGAFVVATSNLGAQESITITADTGGVSLPIGLFVCPTDAASGDCLAGQGPAVSATVEMGASEAGTFAVFAQQINATDVISFDPANNRAFVRFRNASGELRGSTSVALRTAP